MSRPSLRLAACLFAAVLGACATRAVDVKPLTTNPSEFATWDCARIDDESDAVQQRAADVAYSVDERVGNNIVALGIGAMVFWPVILAMRPDGPEADELARLKGRYEALRVASSIKACPPPALNLSPQRAAALPVAIGDRLVYEDRIGGRGPATEWVLQLHALRRDEVEFRLETAAGLQLWRQDAAGNVTAAPSGALHWPRLLRRELALGQVLSGHMAIAGDPLTRARLRGQVVAEGPQTIAGRRFDVAVIELFGDAQREDLTTRLDGAIVVDRGSGVLVRLDLVSSTDGFNLQRRLVRVERPPPP